MPTCPRCFSLIDGDLPYCPVCDRPRIVEGLRAPATPPWWQEPLQWTLLVIGTVWLVVTVGVAFLREFKAVRDSRQLLAENQLGAAWQQLSPFVTEHPDHVQGLLLCGQETMRLGLMNDASQCYAKLSTLEPDLAKGLAEEYRQALTGRARAQGCNPGAFGALLADAEKVGAAFRPSVLAGLDRVVEACRDNNYQYPRYQLATLLKEKGLSGELVSQGYVPAIGQALAAGKYNTARVLAVQGGQVVAAGVPAIDAALEPERQRVAATITTLGRICQTLGSDPKFHAGSSWCFPTAAPPAVQAVKDAWGHPVLYNRMGEPDAKGCSPGFIVSSYGVLGAWANERTSPAAGIECRSFNGSEAWQLPHGFWMAGPKTAAAASTAAGTTTTTTAAGGGAPHPATGR